ncbi:hypothetical protein C8J57DRAFT_1225040 [Mycena rebaudengoi]|nr:hypothetical protein C8J57DRAFT_1225040 [Mycena rebaudengoi]
MSTEAGQLEGAPPATRGSRGRGRGTAGVGRGGRGLGNGGRGASNRGGAPVTPTQAAPSGSLLETPTAEEAADRTLNAAKDSDYEEPPSPKRSRGRPKKAEPGKAPSTRKTTHKVLGSDDEGPAPKKKKTGIAVNLVSSPSVPPRSRQCQTRTPDDIKIAEGAFGATYDRQLQAAIATQQIRTLKSELIRSGELLESTIPAPVAPTAIAAQQDITSLVPAAFQSLWTRQNNTADVILSALDPAVPDPLPLLSLPQGDDESISIPSAVDAAR